MTTPSSELYRELPLGEDPENVHWDRNEQDEINHDAETIVGDFPKIPTVPYCVIPLTKGQVAFVSPHRYEDLASFSWGAAWSNDTQSYYAVRTSYGEGGSKTTIRMHRQILGFECGDPREVDHGDHNTLDNTDRNLRVATRSQQMQNRKLFKNSKSQYKGIRACKGNRRWQVRIQVGGIRKHIGYFSTAELAHAAYCKEAEKLHKEFCWTS